MIEKLLNDYFMVNLNKKLSLSNRAKLIPSKNYNEINLLWKEHQKIQNDLDNGKYKCLNDGIPDFSYLDLKIKIANKIFKECIFCPRKCKVDRNNETGFCGVRNPIISSELFNQNETLPIIFKTDSNINYNIKANISNNYNINSNSNINSKHNSNSTIDSDIICNTDPNTDFNIVSNSDSVTEYNNSNNNYNNNFNNNFDNCNVDSKKDLNNNDNNNSNILENNNYNYNYCKKSSLCIAGLNKESPLIPSHKVFFSGCTLSCAFCQNHEISINPNNGIFINKKDLAFKIDNNRLAGSSNVNFVGGEPTPNLNFILETIKLTKKNIPIIYNSNMYLSAETMSLLNGFVDLYLTDFKFGNNKCASMLSGVSDYMEIVGNNHKIALSSGNIIIRHLVLPNHIKCCSIPLIDWIVENLGVNVVLDIVDKYKPFYKANDYEDLSKAVQTKDVEKVIDYAKSLGLNNIIKT